MRLGLALLQLLAVSYGISLNGIIPFGSSVDLFGLHDYRLIKTGPEEYEVISELAKLEYRRSNKRFIDVTKQIPIEDAAKMGLVRRPLLGFWSKIKVLGGKQLNFLLEPIKEHEYPAKAEHSEDVKRMFKNIDTDLAKSNLGEFTSFFTRYYKSPTGLDSANWLYDKIQNTTAPVLDRVNITKVHHSGWDQYSIIVSIPGKKASKVIAGSHQDSANLILPNLLRAPGADDNGSGTVTCLETLRVLVDELQNGYQPYNTVELHFYSAEEGGLLGSIDVFSRYAANGDEVRAMLQQDMTGFTAKTTDNGVEPHFGLIMDYTSTKLNEYLKVLIKEYCSIPYHETECGYACSDHASAIEHGYPASFVIESEMKYSSGYIHSVLDTIDRLDWAHVTEHIKLTISYLYELSLQK